MDTYEGFTLMKSLRQPDGSYYVEALCDSSIEKPTNFADNSLCVETDTGKVCKLRGGVWGEFGEG